ncbi:glycosyltransferase family 9 protein [Candidatus Omnitrophota bacterium]
MAQRVLVINPFGVGDVLFSTPLVSALKEQYSGSYIAYICNTRTKEILETNPDIDSVFVFERDEYRKLWKKSKTKSIREFWKFWKRVAMEKFDIVIDLSMGKEFAFLCWLIGIKERRGFNYKGRGRFLTHKIAFNGFNDKPVAEYYLDIIRRVTGCGLRVTGTVLLPIEEDRIYIDKFLKCKKSLLIGIAPGGGISFGKKDQDRRRWGAAKFSQLADSIVEKYNANIVLIWGPGEEDLAKEISSLMKHDALIAPATTIRQMAELCKRCGTVICSEGGPLHIAVSQGIKTISIFGPVDEKVYGPYPASKNNIVVASSRECRPCYKRFKLPECAAKECIEEISVDKVLDAFIMVMSK